MSAALCLVTGQAQALSARISTGQVVEIASAADLQLAVRRLIAAGLFDDARRLARAYEPGHPDHAVRMAYTDALVAQAQGNDMEAVRLYRMILAQRPDLDLVRVQLTGALGRLGMHDGAKAQAERLIASGVDDRLDGQLSSLLRTLDAERPLSFRGYVSLLPSSNINNGTNRSSVALGPVTGVIPKNQQRMSGLGYASGAQLAFRQQVSPRFAAIGALEARLENFPEIARRNLTGQGSVGVEARTARGTVLARVFQGGAMVDGQRTYRYQGLGVETDQRLGAAWRLRTGAEYRYEQFDAAPGDNGDYLDIPVQLDRFTGPESFVRFIAGGSFGRKAQDRFSFDEGRIGLGYYREFPKGVSAYAEGIAARRTYHAPYPGIPDPRRDERLQLGLTLTKRDLVVMGFAPQVSLTSKRNRSNAAFHDTTKHALDIRFTRDF
ncbi:surface lipoprotein assembly modifier [Sagittula salina]|uniref:DUF560 domain-containing protein n=1 Tax=Sagittula salina TaxID=2820268 RepID=A0A940MPU0_9RHOB|nr:surface lipoprotein assembly modifier [Sagittula salina]MBP0482737.1 DUF560 domain-containing protein [Sagittula salina]